MMGRWERVAVAALAVTLAGFTLHAQQSNDKELLRVRETVWRAWFAGDIDTLSKLVPSDTIVMSASEAQWKLQADVLKEAREFHANGGRLTRLEFPRTEVQHFGNAAIIWSSYILETQLKGKTTRSAGRVTEIFVHRDGAWVNPGWHTDSVE